MTAPDEDDALDDALDDDRPSWLEGLAALLNEQGHGTYRPDLEAYPPDTEWPIYLEWVPEQPDEVITLTGYGGAEATVGAEPAVQVRVRGGPDPRTSRRKAEAIRAYLHDLAGGAFLGDGSWLVCAPNPGGVIHHGRDPAHRHEHITNHRLTIDPPEGSP